jgi:Serine acetyltransferase
MICNTIRECFCVDMRLHEKNVTAWKMLCLSLRETRVMAVVLLRISQLLAQKRILWRLAPYIKTLNEILTGFDCNIHAVIGEGFFVAHTNGIVIGEGVVLGKKVIVYNGVTFGARGRGSNEKKRRFPIIEDEVIVYTGAKVIGPIVVGKGAVVGANTVVLNDIPPGSVAVGVPAKILPREA